MKPWLQPYHDALEVLIPSKPQKEPQFAAKMAGKKKKKKRDDAMAMMTTPQPSHGGGHHHNGPPAQRFCWIRH